MSIDELRVRIDATDRELVRLLAERLAISREIGEEKDRAGLPVLDAARERRVIERVRTLAQEYGIDERDAERVYERVMEASKAMQHTTVAFQGEPGAFSEQAALEFFGRSATTLPRESFDAVFTAVAEERTRFGIVPVENSSEGSISRVYDLFLDHDVRVCGETALRIVHCLIAREGVALGDIRRVYSHPQALGQCREFLTHLGCELVPSYDTAGSVKMLAESGMDDAAAVAGARAAEIYRMRVVASGIEDSKNNYTRFFILSKRDVPPSGNDKTSVVFSVRHEPGALYSALRVLAERGVNLTKIESRPTRQKPWEYNFYLDFEGHRLDPQFADALESVRPYCLFLRVLGSYPQAKPVWKTL
jgi:chorismate mutase / prephenate dehydratase